MNSPVKKPTNYAGIEALPGYLVGEILYGELVDQPPPHRRHGDATSAGGAISTNVHQSGVDGTGGSIFVDGSEPHLDPHVAVSNIADRQRDRATEPFHQALFEGASDWTCEVLSPRTEYADKHDRRQLHDVFGVRHPSHTAPRTRVLFYPEDVCAPPFHAITFSLGLLWPFDPPATEKPADEQK